MTLAYGLGSDTRELARVLAGVERGVHIGSGIAQTGSGFMAAGAAHLHMVEQKASFLSSVSVPAIVGIMTTAVLFSFTAAALKLVPRVKEGFQAAAIAATLVGVGAFTAVSGTSNATFLGYSEAKSLEAEAYLTQAEEGFHDAQDNATSMSQILPILAMGRDVIASQQSQEDKAGETGTGQGPIFNEMMSQHTRLTRGEADVRALVEQIQPLIRQGQEVLERLRVVMKDGKASEDDKQRALQNALTRLSSIATEIRKKVPVASLRALAKQLRAPVTLQRYSSDAKTREIQEESARRLQAQFEPIGAALDSAVTEIEDRTDVPVPVYKKKSPAQLVFSHIDELWFIVGVGYALDLLPFAAVALILIAHRQLGRTSSPAFPAAPGLSALHPRRGRKPNGTADEPASHSIGEEMA